MFFYAQPGSIKPDRAIIGGATNPHSKLFLAETLFLARNLVMRVGGLTPPEVGQAAPTTRLEPFSRGGMTPPKGHMSHMAACAVSHMPLWDSPHLELLTWIAIFSKSFLAM